MVTALSPGVVPQDAEEPRILLRNVPWSTYVQLCDAVDSANVHMTYLEGLLEIMTRGRRHELSKTSIARFIELFCLERDIPLFGYGEMTVREEGKKRGLEPDEWYARGEDKELPEIAVEVVVTSPLLDKLEVFRGLGIREVWVFQQGAFTVLANRGDRYEAVTVSEIIPEIDLARIAYYLAQPDLHEALKAFRDELRGQ